MLDHELDDELNNLPEDERELAEYLLKSFDEYKSSRPKDYEVIRRARKKDISFYEANKELRSEAKTSQKESIGDFRKRMKPHLSKNVRAKLGFKDAGRPSGSKSKNVKYSKAELNTKLENFITSYFNEQGEEPTQQEASKALKLGYAKALQWLRQSYGDKRDWRILVREVLEK
jgi:hypothetical protein